MSEMSAISQPLPWPDTDHETLRQRAGRRGTARHAHALAVRARTGATDTRAVALARAMEACGACPDAVAEAAAAMLNGAVVDVRGSDRRQQALCVAALALALLHPGVHLCTTGDTETSALDSVLSPVAARLGLDLGIVAKKTEIAARQRAYRTPLTIVSATELATDVLRDRQTSRSTPSSLVVKIGRLTGRTGRVIVPEVRSVLVSDGDAILLDNARMVVTLHDSLPPLDPPDALEQAAGLAMLLTIPDDATATNNGFVLTQTGQTFVGGVAHLYPALAVDTAVGRRRLLEALAAVHGFHSGTHFSVERGRIVEHAANDGALIGFDAARPYLEAAHGIAPTPRMVPVARSRLQRVLSRYQVVAGAGFAMHRAGRELRRLYPVGGPIRVGRPSPRRLAIRTLAGADEIVRYVASLGTVLVILPDVPDAVERLRKKLTLKAPSAQLMLANEAGTPKAPKHIVLLTGLGPEVADLRRIEDLTCEETRVERVIDTTAAPYLHWPRWLRMVLAAMPSRMIRDWLTAQVIALNDMVGAHKNARARSALFGYDRRLDDMLSFAGEAE